MTRKIRMGLRAALVAALSTTITFSPVSAGWLLRRGCKPQCHTPCPPAPCVIYCPPVNPCEVLSQPCCGGDIGGEAIGQPAVESYGEAIDQAPPRDDAAAPENANQQQPNQQQPNQQQPEPQPLPAEDAPASEPPVPSPSDVDEQPEAIEPFDQAEGLEPAPAEQPAPVTPPAEAAPAEAAPPQQPADEAAETPFDAFDDPAPLEQPPAEPAVPENEDLFNFDSAPEAVEPAEPAAPAGEDTDLFDELTPEPAEPAEATAEDIFGELEAPADSVEEAVDAAAEGVEEAVDAFDDLLEPTSTDSEQQKEQQQSIFDELFSAADAQSGRVAPPVTTVSVPAMRPVPVAIDATEVRLWVDNTGHFSTEGRVVEITETHVRILKANGRTCTVGLHRLSPSDAAYVAQVAALLEQPADLVAANR